MRPRLIGSLARDRRGGVAVAAALGGTVLCGAAALAVDLGSIALHARKLQGAADLAALAAARDLDRAEAAALATARDNLGPQVTAQVTLGSYVADPARRPADRFTPGEAAPNAARVALTGAAPLYFGRWLLGREDAAVTRRATAAVGSGRPLAMFSIGSRLARLDGGVANSLLSSLTGSTVSLTVMDYRALADADVSLLQFADALATEMDITAGDYEALLDAEVDAGRALGVLERLTGGPGGGALNKLARAADGMRVRIGRLIGAETDAPDALKGGLDARVSALDLATALLETGGGERQLALDLGAQPGLAEVRASLAIGERPNHSPWIAVTDTGTPIIRTAQARLYVKARTAQKLSGLAQVELPILIELAASEARLQRLECDPRAVTLGVRPGVARAMIASIDETKLADFKAPLAPQRATLLSVLGLVTITGRADIEAADQGFQGVRFTDAEISAQETKTVSSRGFVGGLVVSLIQRLDIDVRVIGLGLGLGNLTQALGVLLTPLGPVLDAAINPLLDTLGLKFGEADVTVHGASCPDGRDRTPTLVS